jgi:hypothetical protein
LDKVKKNKEKSRFEFFRYPQICPQPVEMAGNVVGRHGADYA